jgi:hypothetical protein
VIARLDYKPLKEDGQPGEREDWEAYGFVQGTASRSGDRDENNRAGVGGGWRINDRLKVLAEASDGNLGAGGKLGADYRLSDRSNAYMTYGMETDNPNNAYRGRQGTWVSGSSMRVSDEVRAFGETRATHGAGPQSLVQAFGLDLSPNDRWNYGVKAEFGTFLICWQVISGARRLASRPVTSSNGSSIPATLNGAMRMEIPIADWETSATTVMSGCCAIRWAMWHRLTGV